MAEDQTPNRSGLVTQPSALDTVPPVSGQFAQSAAPSAAPNLPAAGQKPGPGVPEARPSPTLPTPGM